MEYEVILRPTAVADMDALRKYDASRVADALEQFLTREPAKESKSRIKRLRGISNPDYRLRIGRFRAFYSVDEQARQVQVLRVMHKDQTRSYYEELKP